MNQKGIAHILLLILLAVGLAAGVYLATTNKLVIFKSRASADAITPVGDNITKTNGVWQTNNPTVQFELKTTLASEKTQSEKTAEKPLNGYDTHPNFWPAGGNRWTAKQYILAPESQTPSQKGVSYNTEYVWSGPYNAIDRYVIYQPYPNSQPGDYREWERWFGNPAIHKAVNYSYGGPSEKAAKRVYKDKDACGRDAFGFDWPQTSRDAPLQFTSLAAKNNKGECLSGGYIAAKIVEFWDAPLSAVRRQKCDNKIPAGVSPNANAVCLAAPNAGVVSQRYVLPEDGNKKISGCEMTVYSWGYPSNAEKNYQNWFRNGELRWSYYKTYDVSEGTQAPHAPDDVWWDSVCEQSWTAATNMIYSGKYKLNNQEFTDKGEAAAESALMTDSVTYQVAYDNLPSTWNDIPEQIYTDNLSITHTFSSTPGDKFIFVKFKTGKGSEQLHQLKIMLIAPTAPAVIPSIVPAAVPQPTPTAPVSTPTPGNPLGTITGPSSVSMSSSQPAVYIAQIAAGLNPFSRATIWIARHNGSAGSRIDASDIAGFDPDQFNCSNGPDCFWYQLSTTSVAGDFRAGFTSLKAGTYMVIVDARDVNRISCSGNPYISYPVSVGGYTFYQCSDSGKDRIQVNVTD